MGKFRLSLSFFTNGEAQKLIKQYYTKNKKIKFIDLSADFRISNYKTYEKNYKIKHKAKSLMDKSLYSIHEFNKTSIKKYGLLQIQDVTQHPFKYL